ncbi:hypothetical protein HK104_006225 [Borealophlyctis nickersoniae]|nr:hypothetical protein HK104_006225 [Borealophlyctis nickersoniae]
MSSGQRTTQTLSDILTAASQMILIGSTAVLIVCACNPERVIEKLAEYKERLTTRRHLKMLEHLSSTRLHLTAAPACPADDEERTDQDDDVDAKETAAMALNGVYHTDVARDVKSLLFEAPVIRYGIITGAKGTGKSWLVRRLTAEEPYVAVLSMGLVNGVKSMVDELGEEVGYDFDDWTERMLQSYFLSGGSNPVATTPSDRLAFLLDEMEEASWKLKYDPANATTQHRPIFVFDDIDALDLDDAPTRKALRMLFNAASKWAREDTAQVIFTCGIQMHREILGTIVRREVLDNAKVFHVDSLPPEQADRFLIDHLTATPSPSDLRLVREKLGTRIGRLIRTCEESNKSHRPIPAIIRDTLSTAVADLAYAVTECASMPGVDQKQFQALLTYLDKRAAVPIYVHEGTSKSKGGVQAELKDVKMLQREWMRGR